MMASSDAGPGTELVSFPRRLRQLAGEHPEATAVVFVSQDGRGESLDWATLESRTNQIARLLCERGARSDDIVAVGLSNCLEHILACQAAWKIGACVLPFSAKLPRYERDGLLDVAKPALIIADESLGSPVVVDRAALARTRWVSDVPLDDIVADPGKAMPSGGSTGRAKVIVELRPWAFAPGAAASYGRSLGMRSGQVQLVAGPLYHNSPFTWTHYGLFEDHTIVLMEQFDAARALDLIERHRVNWAFFVPTMLKRMADVADIESRDLSSVEVFWHTAAPCPPSVKRQWIELLGDERLVEAYGATEATGVTIIRGDEWLKRPGSVGRPIGTEIRILDEDGVTVPPGTIGEIYMRPKGRTTPTFEYRGAHRAKCDPDGYVSVGDLGSLDDEGWLFLADRRTDLILTGGANVYPAEVEAALHEYADVLDVAVIGRPDPDWGRRVHAVVQACDPENPPSEHDLDAHCRQRLAAYKCPKTYEFVDVLPRNEAGKLRRSTLVESA